MINNNCCLIIIICQNIHKFKYSNSVGKLSLKNLCVALARHCYSLYAIYETKTNKKKTEINNKMNLLK